MPRKPDEYIVHILISGGHREEVRFPTIQEFQKWATSIRAFEILLHWNVQVDTPIFAGEVTELSLFGTDVTDESLRSLKAFSKLEHLNLRATAVTHRGLRHLAGLQKLDVIELNESQIGDDVLRVLNEFDLLHTISAADDDEGLTASSYDTVRSLSLCRGPLTDAGLKELRRLKNLTWLDLRETKVSDAGLEEVAKHSKLTHVLLKDTQVTQRGIEKLRAALPNCNVRN